MTHDPSHSLLAFFLFRRVRFGNLNGRAAPRFLLMQTANKKKVSKLLNSRPRFLLVLGLLGPCTQTWWQRWQILFGTEMAQAAGFSRHVKHQARYLASQLD